jgi:hypothetical protein
VIGEIPGGGERQGSSSALREKKLERNVVIFLTQRFCLKYRPFKSP